MVIDHLQEFCNGEGVLTTSFSNLQKLAIGHQKAVDTAGKSASRSARTSQAANLLRLGQLIRS